MPVKYPAKGERGGIKGSAAALCFSGEKNKNTLPSFERLTK